jgi:hypothetical protein
MIVFPGFSMRVILIGRVPSLTASPQPISHTSCTRSPTAVRLLIECDGVEFANVAWSRKNRLAGRPFMEHQLEIMDFYVGLQCAARARADVRLIHSDELVAACPDQRVSVRNPFTLRVPLTHRGVIRQTGLAPDLVFGLRLPDGSRRHFMVEIDRGTMPVVRSDILKQTGFEKKNARVPLRSRRETARAAIRMEDLPLLTVTTDDHRAGSMMGALRQLRVPHRPGASLFLFSTQAELRGNDPLVQAWHDGHGREVRFI